MAESKVVEQEKPRASKPPKRPGRWRRRLLVAIPIAVAIYAVVGFLVVPWVAQRWVVPMVSEMLNGDVAVDSIQTNPFTLSLTLGGVEVTDEQGTKVLGLGRLYGNLQASSLFREGFVLRDVSMDEPYVLAVLEEDGSLNLAKLVKPSSEPSTEPITLPRVRGNALAINEATVEFVDHMVAGSPDRKITPISFNVDAFDTQPLHSNRHHFSAATEAAENVTWEGEVYLNPLDATGTILVKDFDLSVYEPYVRRFAPLAIEGGLASLELTYEVAPARTDKAVSATLATLTVSGLGVELAEHPLLGVETFTIETAVADAVARSVDVQRVAVSGVEVTGQRAADGTLAVLTTLEAVTSGVAADEDVSPETLSKEAALLPTELADSVPRPYDEAVRALIATANDAVQPWTIRLERLEVDNTSASWEDLAVEPNVTLAVTDTRFAAGPITSEDGFATDFEVATNVASGGAIAVTGRLDPLAMKANVESFENTGFALAPFGPYVAMVDPRLRLPDGTLDLTGAGLAASLSEDGTPEVTVGRFTVAGAIDLEVHDIGAPLRDIDVELANLDTAAGDPADLSVQTRVYDGGVRVNGTVLPNLTEPLGSAIDMSVVIDEFQLPPLSPVSGEFVGKAIDGGALSTKGERGITVQLDSSQRLNAEVPLRINGFDFGESVPSDNATKLPVGLAVALLKNPVTGVIDLPTVPISGDLSDPQVSVGGLVVNAFSNLVTGIAASPFQMLGSLVPSGEGDAGEAPDLSFVAFAPGSSALTAEAIKKLDRLGQALVQRPELAMSVSGVPTRALDEMALRRVAFEAALREKTAVALPADDSRKADPSMISVSDEQYREAIRFAHAAMQAPASEQPSTAAASSEGTEETAGRPPAGTDASADSSPSEESADELSSEKLAEADAASNVPVAEVAEAEIATEEIVVNEPAAIDLELPVLADDGGVSLEAASAGSGEPRPRARRLRAGRSVGARVPRSRAVVVEPASEPEVRPLSLPPSEVEAEVFTDESNVADEAMVEADPPASNETKTADASAHAAEQTDDAEPAEQLTADPEFTEPAEAAALAATPVEPLVPFEQAEREVLARVPLAAEAFTDLRSARVAATAAYLTSEAGLPSSRVRVSDAPAEPD
ncbi:MAG: DUF748 domain-containing protein, partial [Planctomycetota bacterium]